MKNLMYEKDNVLVKVNFHSMFQKKVNAHENTKGYRE